MSAHFTYFRSSVEGLSRPEKFTFPFYYDPHPLGIRAAEELMEYLNEQKDWDHNFGLIEGQDGIVIGKMFGVLVVENENGELGYLSAFSGKLANSNHHEGFVPPVFDILEENGIFRTGEKIITAINSRIEELENDPELERLTKEKEALIALSNNELESIKSIIKSAKQERKILRAKAEIELQGDDLFNFLEELRKQSIREQYTLKDLVSNYRSRLENLDQKIDAYTTVIEQLKEERKTRSASLQQELFDQYTFLNSEGEWKSLWKIFERTADGRPPAGAGECAAPKLLHYAFTHGLRPIALTEFWWGASPRSEVRVHGHYYPACRGKCEPILGYMLKGIEMDDNPMLQNPADGKEIDIVYEDEHLVVVNKPAEFLSVPGKNIEDSVYLRMHYKYPDATGPMIVHRLDMSTSGLMIISRSKDVHEHLQRQFIRRHVKKRYVALLEGLIQEDKGKIDLPLRVDLDDRPRQLVCYDHGKYAITEYEVIERKDGRTRVHFYPITGRTHQLRVHSAHSLGLNSPIVGDDLYGTKQDRLYLHADQITFTHPVTKELITVQIDPEF
jgi:tRNA pseudouridine32 synthase/23S rRNA pseudouridine746 synthase